MTVKTCGACVHWNRRSCPAYDTDKINKDAFFFNPEQSPICDGEFFKRKKKNPVESEPDMGEALTLLNEKFIFKCPTDTKELLAFNAGHYVPAECKVHEVLEETYGENLSSHFVEETVKHLQRKNYVEREEINKFTNKIPVKNGLLNLLTRDLEPFDPEQIFTYKLNVVYDPSAECSNWLKFLSQILRPEDILLLQEMRIRWVRGNEKIRFNRPHTFFGVGVRGSAKSTFLETIGCYYLEKGNCILDLFGSRDGEGLAWLRSPYAKDKRILLTHGENVSVTAPCDTKASTKVTLSDFEKYDIVISASPLYLGPDDEFINAALLTDKIYKRLSWKRLVYCLCREAANLFYSRLKISESQIVSKAMMTYLIREARHVGMALGLDSTRYYSIDIDIRNLSDFIILKSQGMTGLTKDLNWLYSIFEPSMIRNMPPQFFIILSKEGSVGLGEFKEIPWHKQERENILKSVGVSVEYGEPVEKGEYRGAFKTVGDVEHADIIKLYVEEGLSLNKIAERIGRSSRTPFEHIHRHNSKVEGAGFCPVCRRVRSKLDKVLARRT